MQERTPASLRFSANVSETKNSTDFFRIYADSIVVANKWGYPVPQPDTAGHPSTDLIEFISDCYSPSSTLLFTSQLSYVFQHYATHFIDTDQIDLVLPPIVNHSRAHVPYCYKMWTWYVFSNIVEPPLWTLLFFSGKVFLISPVYHAFYFTKWLSRLCSTHTHHGQICCHNTDYIHVIGHDRTVTVILAKHCIKVPDDGSLVIQNMMEQF